MILVPAAELVAETTRVMAEAMQKARGMPGLRNSPITAILGKALRSSSLSSEFLAKEPVIAAAPMYCRRVTLNPIKDHLRPASVEFEAFA